MRLIEDCLSERILTGDIKVSVERCVLLDTCAGMRQASKSSLLSITAS